MLLTPTIEPIQAARASSRLVKTARRLQAQLACLAFAFEDISAKAGVVAELGLGMGRTYDHLRWHLGDREIYVFDRVNAALADCQPPPDRLILGEIAATFPRFVGDFAGRVVLANCDLGSADRASNRAVAEMVSSLVPPAMAAGGLIMADLPISPDDCEPLPLPAGAEDGSYFLFRKR
ncbi:Methyltransferase, putative [Rhabdaerophilaceae bacterium]